MNTAITVRQLNLYVKSLLEGDRRLADVTVTGEISNYKNHYASGHWYFSLKDQDATIRCVMFRSAAARVKFAVSDGMQVQLRGRVSIYEKDGQYQFYAEEMLPAGIGDIALQFELVKQKLSAEGLFDAESKRPLPSFPSQIAVITSDTGAAVQDILNITARRCPMCRILMCPVAVQGENAVGQMLDALERVYRLGTADLIIIGRGGGSIEDLWAFNSEELARKIYESPIPVISAVGHETDFTICDFVADLRAPTPSAAAEIAVPDMLEVRSRLEGATASLKRGLRHAYEVNQTRLSAILSKPFWRNPLMLIEESTQQADSLNERLSRAMFEKLRTATDSFEEKVIRLQDLSPLKTMIRGYSVALKDGQTVRSVSQLNNGDRLQLRISDGAANCVVEGVERYVDENERV